MSTLSCGCICKSITNSIVFVSASVLVAFKVHPVSCDTHCRLDTDLLAYIIEKNIKVTDEMY